jgi:hypothetical protein
LLYSFESNQHTFGSFHFVPPPDFLIAKMRNSGGSMRPAADPKLNRINSASNETGITT